MNKMVNKLLAAMLVITLTFANLILLGTYATESFALSNELENQTTLIRDKVNFDAYFLNEKGEKTHSKAMNVDSQEETIYIAVQVLEGYLRNAKVTLTDSNFQFVDVSANYDAVQSISDKEITLNQIGTESEIVLQIPITVSKGDKVSLDNFTKENQIMISGSLIGNKGRTIEVENTIRAKLNLHGEANPTISQEVSKFTPYHVGETNGFMLQTIVKSGLENNTLPIEETNIEVEVPTLKDGTKPDQVMVSAISLAATQNSKEAGSFTQDNWTYDAEQGKVSISVKNEKDNQNLVNWGTGLDEFEVTYIFENKAMPTEFSVKLASHLAIKVYNNEVTEVETEEQKDTVLEEQIGDIVTFALSATDSLGKGYIYANSNYETTYETTWTADLGYADLVDQITMKDTSDEFVDQEGRTFTTSLGDTGYIYYKSTKIAKENFDKILGADENASIQIYDQASSELVATINANTLVDDAGNYVVNYTKDINSMMIQTSKPVAEGKLELQHTKAIKAQMDYSMSQLKSFTQLRTDLVGAILNGDTKLVEERKDKDITLTEPTTKIDAFVNNQKNIDLSTVVENQNVQFRVVLENNDVTADLFKNPTIEVVFPSYIEEMRISNIGLLFDEELAINEEGIQTYHKEDGRAALQIPLTGEQTVYNFNQTQKGTNLVIDASIKAKKLTPSINTEIETFVTNENANSYEQEKEGKAYQSLTANFVAPTGMVTVNSISNYSETGEEIMSSNGAENVGKIAVQTGARTAKITATVLNNFEETCKNISVLGRIPFKGNKSLASGEELGSTFTAKMVSAITAESGVDSSKVTVYYSQNEMANNDLTNQDNGWTTDASNLANVKSYLVVLTDYEMAKGDSFVLSYNVEIPENLPHNESAYATYAVIFEKDNGPAKEIAPKVGISTMEGINLETKLSNDVEENVAVQEGQTITYTLEITNTGKVDAENLVVTSDIPEELVYLKFIPADVDEDGSAAYLPARYVEKPDIKTYTENIDVIKVGETKTVTFKLKAVSLNGATSKVAEVTAKVESKDYTEDTYTTNAVKTNIEKGYLEITIDNATRKGLVEGSKIFDTIRIRNVNDEVKTNVVITYELPKEIVYEDAYTMDSEGEKVRDSFSYDEETRTITYTIGTLGAKESNEFHIRTVVDKVNEEVTETAYITASCDQTTSITKSGAITLHMVAPKLSIQQESDIAPGRVGEGQIITYNIQVTNDGSGNAKGVVVTDYIPEGMSYVKTNYGIDEYSSTSTMNTTEATVLTDIPAGKTLKVQVLAKTNKLTAGEAEKEITNTVKVAATNAAEIEANTITHIIDSTATPSSSGTGGSSGNGGSSLSKYRISGSVWVDINEDGSKEDSEERLNGVEVALISTDNNTLVNRTVTNSSGQYTFSEVENGRYMVAFLYDSVLYTITEYRKAGVNETRNSDAIENSITVENQVVTGAITDNIDINGSSVYNVDLGLVARNKFDLSLSKSIDTITVKTSNGTRNYEYNDGTTLAKIDIAPKRIDGANVVITYKFVVRNEGNVAGCANKIVDYLPSELKFNTNMNPDWYEGENGAIYNSSLANDMIAPGESRVLTLTLTKTMTGESTGIVNNTAEIYEAYNDLALMDINSTPANKAQGENDMGSADVLLTVNTGEPVMYITITIAMLAMVAVGVYIINKKVLKKSI